MKKEEASPNFELNPPPDLLTYSRLLLNAARKLNLQIALAPSNKKTEHAQVRKNIADLKTKLQELEDFLDRQQEETVP